MELLIFLDKIVFLHASSNLKGKENNVSVHGQVQKVKYLNDYIQFSKGCSRIK